MKTQTLEPEATPCTVRHPITGKLIYNESEWKDEENNWIVEKNKNVGTPEKAFPKEKEK